MEVGVKMGVGVTAGAGWENVRYAETVREGCFVDAGPSEVLVVVPAVCWGVLGPKKRQGCNWCCLHVDPDIASMGLPLQHDRETNKIAGDAKSRIATVEQPACLVPVVA